MKDPRIPAVLILAEHLISTSPSSRLFQYPLFVSKTSATKPEFYYLTELLRKPDSDNPTNTL